MGITINWGRLKLHSLRVEKGLAFIRWSIILWKKLIVKRDLWTDYNWEETENLGDFEDHSIEY